MDKFKGGVYFQHPDLVRVQGRQCVGLKDRREVSR